MGWRDGVPGGSRAARQCGRAPETRAAAGRRIAGLPGRGSRRAFQLALIQFTTLSDDQAIVLYALRCAVMHSFGLANLNDNPDLQHRFSLSTDGPYVRRRQKPWDGNYLQPVRRSMTTHVNLRKLGDRVEDAVARTRELHGRGEVVRAVATDEDLMQRFTFAIVG